MKLDIIVPKAGLTMTEAEISTWLVNEGDHVEKEAPIAELMTEKITVEVVAPETGIIAKILKTEGEEVLVGETIAVLSTEGDSESTEVAASEEESVDKSEETFQEFNESSSYDVAIIGGGPGGYVAAIRAAQLGGNVALIEQKHLGGVCLNAGCIPTKTLLTGVDFVKLHSQAKDYGVDYDDPTIDFSKLMQKKDSVIQTLTSGIQHLLKKNKVEVFNGKGTVVNERTVQVEDESGKTEEIRAKNIILATGSEAFIPNIPGLKDMVPLTSKTALEKETLPESIAIIGAGAIGCEFAAIYAPLGVKVTLIESENEILPGLDPDISEFLNESLITDGVEILTSSKVNEVYAKNNEKVLFIEAKGVAKEVAVEEILVATGRKAKAEGLDQIGIKLENNAVKVNEKLETSIPSIYAIGDVTGVGSLAHTASAQGIVAAENAMGKASKIAYDLIPKVIYTSPEVASVGLTETEAKESNISFEVGKYHFQANGRAHSSDSTDGFIKLIRGKKYNQILGVHIVGESASELIGQAVLAMELEATTEELGRTIMPHPSLSEGVMESALASMGIGIHS